jgi:hypothetical protein
LTDEHSDVLAVVRRFLERPLADFPLELLVPDLAERAAIMRSVPVTYEVVNYHPEIRRLEVIAIDGDIAVCVCNATLRTESLAGDAKLPYVYREVIAGEIRLVRSADLWQIADYPRNGLPVRSTFKLYDRASVTEGAFAITPLLLQRLASGIVQLTCKVENRGSSPARITRLRARLGRFPRLRWRTGVVRGQTMLKVGASGMIDAGGRGSRAATELVLEFEFLVKSGGTETRIPLALPGFD